LRGRDVREMNVGGGSEREGETGKCLILTLKGKKSFLF